MSLHYFKSIIAIMLIYKGEGIIELDDSVELFTNKRKDNSIGLLGA